MVPNSTKWCIVFARRKIKISRETWRDKIPMCRPPALYWRSGPNGIKNFNPGIFRDGILPNPGIPGFFGTGFSNIFDPGILGKTFGIFWDFHFYFYLLVKLDHFYQSLSSPSSFITNYPPLSSPFIEIIIGNPPQSLPSNRCKKYRLVTMPITVLICWKDFSPECSVLCALSKRCQKWCIYHTNHN